MKIIDCFTFYNEIDLLIYRLNILNDIVDYFIIVESTHTHVGKEKILYFQENINLFDKFKDKIIHVIINDFKYKYPNINIKNGEQWINEKYQRNCIHNGLLNIRNLNNDDYIIISDVDEIPNPNLLKYLKNNNIIWNKLLSLEMELYYFNLNTLFKHKWYKAKIMTYMKYKQLNLCCDDIRMMNNNNKINRGGWHLSYFGNYEFIKNKIINFAHQEFNNDIITNEIYVNDKINNSTDLFGRDEEMKKISINKNNFLPPDYQIYLNNFYSY